MKTRIIIAVTFISGFFIGATLFSAAIWKDSEITYEKSDLLLTLKPQSATERTIIDSGIIELWSGGFDEDHSVFEPGRLSINDRNEVYIIDYHDNRFKKIDADNVIHYGAGGRGMGPGEFQMPDGIAVIGDTIYILDSVQMKISAFKETELIYEELLKDLSYRMCGTNDHLVLTTPSKETFFSIKGLSDRSTRSSGKLTDNPQLSLIALDGNLHCGLNHFYYHSLYSGFILAYRYNGELDFARQTIDYQPLPDISVSSTPTGGTVIRSPSNDIIRNRYITASENQIFILSREKSNDDFNYFIDVYRKHDGEYLHSYDFPEDAMRLLVSDDWIFTVSNEHGLKKWSHRFPGL